MNRLRNLLQRNKGRGRFDIKVEAGGATIYLYDAIVDTDMDAEWLGGVSAESFVRALADTDADVIHLRINSPGGSVFGARAMETALRQNRAHVVAHIDGLAASAASFIAMAGDEIEIAEGGFLMIHKAWSLAMGNADEMRHEADLLDKIDDTLANTYAAKTGIDRADIADMLAAETWFTGAEAVERGFADRIAADAPAADAWDLSAYSNAPKPKQALTLEVDASAVQTVVKAALDEAAEVVVRKRRHRDVLRKLIPA